MSGITFGRFGGAAALPGRMRQWMESGTQALPVVAALFAGVLLAHAMWTIARPWIPGMGADDEATQPAAPVTPAPVRPSAVRELTQIDPFGRAPPAVSKGSGTQGAGPAAETRLNLILRGVAAPVGEGSEPGMAIIHKPGGEERPFRRGADVFGLARLEAIHPDHVTLRHQGRIEILRLPREGDSLVAPAGAQAPRMPPPTPNRSLATPVAPVPLPDAAEAAESDEDETPGLKIDGEMAGMFNVPGLQPGDIVETINGSPVGLGTEIEDAIDALETAPKIKLGVRRDGQLVQIDVDRPGVTDDGEEDAAPIPPGEAATVEGEGEGDDAQ